MIRRLLLAGMLCALRVPAPVFAQGPVPAIAMPNPELFPGATNPDVTQENVDITICRPGWTKTIRPPASYTNALKKAEQRTLGYDAPNPLPRVKSAKGKRAIRDVSKCKADSANPACWEEDHLISLELGGDPRSPDNLWPEPWFGPWNAHVKDRLETKLKSLVCTGTASLAEAQQAIATDWVAAYRKYVAANP